MSTSIEMSRARVQALKAAGITHRTQERPLKGLQAVRLEGTAADVLLPQVGSSGADSLKFYIDSLKLSPAYADRNDGSLPYFRNPKSQWGDQSASIEALASARVQDVPLTANDNRPVVAIMVNEPMELVDDVSKTPHEGVGPGWRTQRELVKQLEEQGARVVIIPPMANVVARTKEDYAKLIKAYVEVADCILVPGGADIHERADSRRKTGATLLGNPTLNQIRDRFEKDVVHAFLDEAKVVYGICRGEQMINYALGGSIKRVEDHAQGQDRFDIGTQRKRYALFEGTNNETEEPVAHQVHLQPGSMVSDLMGGEMVVLTNSHHSWAADVFGEGVEATGHTTDGVVESFDVHGKPSQTVAVQWHPEPLQSEIAANDGGAGARVAEQVALLKGVMELARIAHESRALEPQDRAAYLRFQTEEFRASRHEAEFL